MVRCPGCGKSFAPPPGSAGESLRCSCGASFVIEESPAPPAAPTPSPLSDPEADRAWSPEWVVRNGVITGWVAFALSFVAYTLWPHSLPAAYLDATASIRERVGQARLLGYLSLAAGVASMSAYWWASNTSHPDRHRVGTAAGFGLGGALLAFAKTHPGVVPFAF